MTRIRLQATAVLAALLLALAGAVLLLDDPRPADAIPTPPSPPAADPDRDRPAVDPEITSGAAQRQLDAARERWAAAAIGSYTMRARVSCFCDSETTRPRTLLVRDGRPARYRGKPVAQALRPFASVPRIHARVQQAIDDRVALLTVRYDRRGGVASLYVDSQLHDRRRGAGDHRRPLPAPALTRRPTSIRPR